MSGGWAAATKASGIALDQLLVSRARRSMA